jgi:hypothetical protein
MDLRSRTIMWHLLLFHILSHSYIFFVNHFELDWLLLYREHRDTASHQEIIWQKYDFTKQGLDSVQTKLSTAWS